MTALCIALFAFIATGAVVEVLYVVQGEPTISKRIQTWGRDNFQVFTGIVALVAVIAGWLLAHFTGVPA